MNVDCARLVLGEKLVNECDTQDAIDGLLEQRGHVVGVCATSLKSEQGSDRLEIILHSMMDLLDHRRLDLELLLLSRLFGDVLNSDDCTGRDVAQSKKPSDQTITMDRHERNHSLDPDLILLLYLLLHADTPLHGFETDVFIRLKVRKLSIHDG